MSRIIANNIRHNDATSDSLNFDSSARVGIGTASPTEKLHVSGSGGTVILVADSSSYAGLSLSGSGSSNFIVSDDRLDFLVNGSTRASILTTGGITFNGDTAAANALDDYEEGTWTPGLGGTGTITAGTAEGVYTKIGNICIARLRIDNATFGGSPDTSVTGLPFTAQQRSTTTDVVIANSFSVTHPQGLVIQSQAYIEFGTNPTNGSGFWSGATISTGTTKYIYCTLIYTVS